MSGEQEISHRQATGRMRIAVCQLLLGALGISAAMAVATLGTHAAASHLLGVVNTESPAAPPSPDPDGGPRQSLDLAVTDDTAGN